MIVTDVGVVLTRYAFVHECVLQVFFIVKSEGEGVGRKRESEERRK